jgi:hypothetical protein
MAALIRITAHLGAVFAAHVPFQLVDWRRIRPPHDIERDGLMGVAAEAADLKVVVARIERIAEGRRGLCP